MISFPCPHCAKVLKVKDVAAGKHGNCPHCAKPIDVPRTSSVSAITESPTLPPKVAGEELQHKAPGAAAHVSTVSSSDGNTLGEPEAVPRPELIAFLAPAQQPDELGRLGSYRILKVLGAGGMGVVFKAEDSQLKRQVALKVMLPTLGASDSARKRFLREAQSAAALDHDHIVHIYQVGEDRGVPFMAMQFLRGRPLDERLKSEPKLPIDEAVRIGWETAKGLAAAHELGLIHRDIKPANLWLEADGRVKILDFGLARAVGDETHLTQDGAIIGTPAYMAPEQASNKPVDHRSDLFSLGCVLYRLCTGEMPFKGSDTLSILSALALQVPIAPVECNPAVPPALSDLIMEMLAKKPEGRPASAQVVAARLQEIAGDQTAVLPSVSKKRSTKVRVDGQAKTVPQQPAAARPTIFWATMAAVLVGLGVGGFFLLRGINTNQGGDRSGDPPGPKPWTNPLDQLTAASISPEEREVGQPTELVAVLGSRHMRHWGWADSFAFGARTLASGNTGGPNRPPGDGVRLWDVSSLREKAFLKEAGKVVGFTAGDKGVVTSSYSGLQVWDVTAEIPVVRETLRSRTSALTGDAVLDGAGKILAAWAADKTVRVWDLTTNPPKERATLDGFTYGNGQLALTRDGRRLAVVDDGRVRVWDLTGAKAKELSSIAILTKKSVNPVGLTAEGDLLAWCSSEGLGLWDTRGAEAKEVLRIKANVAHIALAPGGKHLAFHLTNSAVELIDLSNTDYKRRRLSDSGSALAFSPDAKLLATASGSSVRIWDIAGAAPVERTEPQWTTDALVLSPDLMQLFCHNLHDTRVWNLAAGHPKRQAVLKKAGDNRGHIAVSPDGAIFASQRYGTIVLWDMTVADPTIWAEITATGISNASPILFMPQGRTLVCGLTDGSVKTWDLSGKVPQDGTSFAAQTHPLTGLGISVDGKILACHAQEAGSVQIWDFHDFEPRKRSSASSPLKSKLAAMALSPDGQTLATRIDGPRSELIQAWLWDVNDGRDLKLRLILKGDQAAKKKKSDEVHRVAFAPDGKRLALIGYYMNQIVVCDVGTGEKLQSLTVPGRCTAVAFADNRHLLVANDNGTIYILRLDNPAAAAAK